MKKDSLDSQKCEINQDMPIGGAEENQREEGAGEDWGREQEQEQEQKKIGEGNRSRSKSRRRLKRKEQEQRRLGKEGAVGAGAEKVEKESRSRRRLEEEGAEEEKTRGGAVCLLIYQLIIDYMITLRKMYHAYDILVHLFLISKPCKPNSN